jgi:catechol 2,3-dioxygenase-like lactoylglutathione lyase family enzyme
VQFYTEVLGFTVKARDRIERSGLGVPIDLVYLDLGGTVVELISYDGATVDPAPQTEHLGYRMMALEVDDMQKTADYLRTKGVERSPRAKRHKARYRSAQRHPSRRPNRSGRSRRHGPGICRGSPRPSAPRRPPIRRQSRARAPRAQYEELLKILGEGAEKGEYRIPQNRDLQPYAPGRIGRPRYRKTTRLVTIAAMCRCQ